MLGLLGLTVLWALHDIYTRRARTEWEGPLEVAVALVQIGPVDPRALSTLRARFPVLEARLAAEYRRYGGRQPERPIEFSVFGPVTVDRAPPTAPDGGVMDLAQHAYAQWRWTHAVDDGSGLPDRAFDSRIYLVVRAPQEKSQNWVEGESELGGRVGVARVELDNTMADLALFVVTHELFHTLGASDKYDSTGRALVPQGLVEPSREPRYPQRFAEVMARNVPISPTFERPPDDLAELGVGAATAREIGWLRGPP